MVKMLHIAAKKPNKMVWIAPFIDALQEIGDVTIIENGNALSEEESWKLHRSLKASIYNTIARAF